MATAAREANQNQKQKQPYEALGAGGKFRKTPFRRTSQTTPYDRPTPNGGGWIAKLVNPAQKLITYGAHRLFSSVFQKRLAPPPPPPPSSSTEVNHEGRIMERDEVAMEPSRVQKGAVSGPTTGDGFSLLEQIFEQKTFTRPEIDRLKELLHSRTVDTPIENIEKRSEVIPSTAVVSHGREEEFAKTPLQDKISTPVVSTTVLDEDVASPVELAKAYMGSRPSKISPLMLGLRSQPAYEDSHISSSVAFPSQSPLMSVVPRFSSNGAENGYSIPRSRGRSAIHSMARTPYSRVQTCSRMKGFGSTVDSYCVPSSSSRSIWEQGQPSGSKQGALKRRFSVLDNDIGSIGPIRRIRPKPNLLSSRGLSSPIVTEAFQNPSSSTNRPLVSGEPKHTPVKALSENGDNAVPRTSFSTVPSQSSKAASKIFEHLDKITSPKEKSSEPKLLTMSDRSPTKLSPSMLRGQALKSLEHVDSSKFLENARYKNGKNLEVSSNQWIPDITSQKDDKVRENGPSGIVAPCANEVESTTGKKDVAVKVKVVVSAASETVAHPPEKKRAFMMSAHEYLELDDDDYSNNSHVSGSFADGRVKVDKMAAANLEKPLGSTEVKPPASFTSNQKSDSRSSDGVYTVASDASDTVPKAAESLKADEKNSDVEIPIRVPETLVSSSSSSATTSIFSTSQVSNDLASPSSFNIMAPAANSNSSNNIATTSAVTTSSSNIFSSASVPSFSADSAFIFPVSTTTAATQVPDSSSLELLRDKNKRDGAFANSSGMCFPGTSAASAGTSAASAGTGSSFMAASAAASSPVLTNQCGPTSLSFGSASASVAASSPASTNQSGPPFFTFSSGPGLSPQAAPGLLFKSEPSTASAAVTTESSGLDSLDDKSKQGGIYGGSTLFGGASATNASTSSNFFGVSAAASTPTFTSQSVGSALSSGGIGTGCSPHVSPAGAVVASLTQSAPVQPSSSASSSVFGFAGNMAFSSGSSALGSSTPSSGVSPSSSSTAPSTTLFSGGWPPATSSKFSSTLNSTASSSAFQFGASSAAAGTNTLSTPFGASSSFAATSNGAATLFGKPSASAPTSNSVPTLFGASTVSAPSTNAASAFGMSNGASSTGMFSFTSSATTAPSQPAFGNSNPAFGFPTSPSGNNDQMSMEDGMAEDTVHASPPTVAVFGQQPISTPQSTFPPFGQQPVSTPQSPFTFASNGFPFQSQPNQSNSQNPPPFQASLPTSQNPSPFQASLPTSQNPSPFQSNSLGLSNSFSLGAADKSNRRIVKVNRSKNRKK